MIKEKKRIQRIQTSDKVWYSISNCNILYSASLYTARQQPPKQTPHRTVLSFCYLLYFKDICTEQKDKIKI